MRTREQRRHLVSLAGLRQGEFGALLGLALDLKRRWPAVDLALEGRTVGLLFQRPSTRTRTTFHVAARRLGADVIAYGTGDLQIETGETIADSARVLSRFIDALVIRTQDTAEVERFACDPGLAVINALTDQEHPTQSIADLMTVHEAFGRLEGIHILFLGDGGNIATSLMQAVSQTPGVKLTLITPRDYAPSEPMFRACADAAPRVGAALELRHSVHDLPRDFDVVYTTRWRSMGEEKPRAGWRADFEPFRVDSALLQRAFRSSEGIFLHDLPAERGAEATSDVLDGRCSRVLEQAENKLFAAMATLLWCFGEAAPRRAE